MPILRLAVDAALVAIALFAFAPFSSSAETETTDPREQELRAAASNKDPTAVRELACFLNGRRQSIFDLDEARTLLALAANAGDDVASLYYSVNLRFGFGIAKNEDEADRVIIGLITKIRRGESSQFPTQIAAAREIYSGRCGFGDPVTASYFSSVDGICRRTKGPKPSWCT